MAKAAFLDRDGVINLDHGYVHTWADFQFIPGAIPGMRLLSKAGFILVVVTNQSGIARGKYTHSDFYELTRQMTAFLATQGVIISAVYHCPHHLQGTVPRWTADCECRKPKPGLILQAAVDLEIDVAQSIMVGDKPVDIEAARAAKVARAFQVTSENLASRRISPLADAHFPDLFACAEWLSGGAAPATN